MAWVCIRKATIEEERELYKRAKRFAQYHYCPRVWPEDWFYSIDRHFSVNERASESFRRQARYQKGLWRRIIRRLTGEPQAQGIVDGYVGYHRRDA